MTVIASLYKVECNFTWQDENEVSTWHCATLEGAHRFIEVKNDLRWYSIEGQDFIPCNEEDPGGQLYIGVTHFEFIDLEKED